jgi:hypothetical protein
MWLEAVFGILVVTVLVCLPFAILAYLLFGRRP